MESVRRPEDSSPVTARNSSMKRLRLFLLILSFGLVACEDPTVPKYPDPDANKDDPTKEKDPEKGGFLLEPTGEYVISYFV
jgi:hypothetical protein